jgi:hypothetical protein
MDGVERVGMAHQSKGTAAAVQSRLLPRPLASKTQTNVCDPNTLLVVYSMFGPPELAHNVEFLLSYFRQPSSSLILVVLKFDFKSKYFLNVM